MQRQTRQRIYRFIFGCLMSGMIFKAQALESWRTLAPGIDYLMLTPFPLSTWSHIHVFRVDPKQQTLDLIMATDFHQQQTSITDFAKHSDALIAINGGFFDPTGKPLGLRLTHHTTHYPLKPISWWGVFYLDNNTPHLQHIRDYTPHASIKWAIQAGPRLIVHHHIPKLKPGYAERTALGITSQGKILLVITEHAPMTTTELAKRMLAPPLECMDALNLDGGSSTQLYVHLPGMNLLETGYALISDAIVIKATH